MDNTDIKISSPSKPGNTDSNLGIRDPSVILPQSKNTPKLTAITKPIEMQAKTDPVMLRSFNKDISEATVKKRKVAPAKASTMPMPPKRPIATSPIPVPKSATVKKEEVTLDKVTPKTIDKRFERKGNLSSEIFPKPPQAQSTKTKVLKKGHTRLAVPLDQKGNTADQNIVDTQNLYADFDKMIYGEYVDRSSDQTGKPKAQPTQQQAHNIKKPIQSTAQKEIEIHISASDLEKIKQEISSMKTVEKELEAELSDLTKQDIILTEQTGRQKDEKAQIKDRLDDILQQEIRIESVIRDIEQEEQAAGSAEDRHNIETRRWNQEERRVQIEKNKWNTGEKYEKLESVLKENEQKLEQVKFLKDAANKKIVVLLKEQKQRETKMHLGEIEQRQKETEDTQMSLLEEKKSIDKTLDLLEENKQKIIKERKSVEESEVKVESISEKRVFEEKRQNMEIRQRSMEQQRWDAEQKLEQIMEKIKKTNIEYKVATETRREIIEKLNC